MEEKHARLLDVLERRFAENPERHPGIAWADVRALLVQNGEYLRIIARMEETGGEPDVAGGRADNGDVLVIDCAKETPTGRRSVCYDDAALAGRKANKPASSALGMARAIGIELLDEAQYRRLQDFGTFDEKTSSWIKTPESIRDLGGALFCDRRYGRVFTYHNGAESYYSARGFRGLLRLTKTPA